MNSELMHNQFAPVNEHGFNPIKTSRGDILVWEYKPTAPPDDLLKDFVVAISPGMGDQYILGPQPAIRQVAKAFNILDALGREELRNMTVIVNPLLTLGKETPDQREYLLELIDRFKLLEKIRGTTFTSDILMSGIKPDVRQPVVRLYDWNDYIPEGAENTIPFLIAGDLIHEWDHAKQLRANLPTNSLWSERSAMSKQAEFLYHILITQKLKMSEELYLIYYIKFLAKKIENYRNGRSFSNHLVRYNGLDEGTPLKNQLLHLNDFSFGR